MNKKRKLIVNNLNNNKKNKIILKNIPLEIWYHILSFITDESAISLRSICINWKLYFQCNMNQFKLFPYNWLIFDIFPNIKKLTLSTEKHISKIYKLTKLQHLIFNNIPGNVYKILVALDHIPSYNIQKITWNCSENNRNDCLKKLLKIIRKSSNIKSFTLINKYSYCQSCLKIYGKLIHLEELEIDQMENITSEFIQEILKLTNLKRLIIINSGIEQFLETQHQILNIVNMNLKSFTISRNLLSNVIFEYFSKFNGFPIQII